MAYGIHPDITDVQGVKADPCTPPTYLGPYSRWWWKGPTSSVQRAQPDLRTEYLVSVSLYKAGGRRGPAGPGRIQVCA